MSASESGTVYDQTVKKKRHSVPVSMAEMGKQGLEARRMEKSKIARKSSQLRPSKKVGCHN